VAYHVEVRSGMHRAWLFNLDAEELRQRVLSPWAAGVKFALADQRWEPRESQLRIVEGARLEAVDMAHGRGWNRAQRTGTDVTDALLKRGAGTVVAATRAGHEAGVALLRELGLEAVDWGLARTALLAGVDAGVELALVMAPAGTGPWLLDAGLVLGALPGRALVIADGPGAPAELAGVRVLPPDAAAVRRSRARD
jgi:hypothetical protein